MSTTLDRAKHEAERIANEMRTSAEKVRQGVESKMAAHRNSDYSFGSIVHQLRTAQLVAMALQSLMLYMEADLIGITGFLLPFIVISVNFYFVGTRWYHQIDGRYDIQQLVSVKDPALKARYGFALFGGFLLALLAHFLATPIPSGVSSLLFNLSNYVSIVTSAAYAGIEAYEGLKNKQR
jgi:hypothetical protein